MVLVRLARRAVIGAFDQPSGVGKMLPELAKAGIKSVNVSLLAKAETVDSAPSSGRDNGRFTGLGKRASWLGEWARVDAQGFGAIVGAGVLAQVLAESPNTSPAGAL